MTPLAIAIKGGRLPVIDLLIKRYRDGACKPKYALCKPVRLGRSQLSPEETVLFT